MHSLEELSVKVAVLEEAQRAAAAELTLLRGQDLQEIKSELKGLRTEFSSSRQGMSRSEKIALAGVLISFTVACLALVAFVVNAPTA